MKTYTVVARDCNSWDPTTGICHVTWDCGHLHRALDTALSCLQTEGSSGRSYHAMIESSDGVAYDRNGINVLD